MAARQITQDGADLQRRFAELSLWSRRLLQDPRLRLGCLAPLNRMALDALAVTKLISAELRRADAGLEPSASPSGLHSLLEANQRQYARLQRQFDLLDWLDRTVEPLQGVVRQLMFTGSCPAAVLLGLARQIVLDIQRTADAGGLEPEPGITAAEWLGREGRLERPEPYASGLLAARLTAWAAGHYQLWDDRLERLVAAALLHNIGVLCLPAPRRGRPGPKEDPRHPYLGAALAGGLADAPVDLPRLIARHHERTDGTGYPAGLTARDLEAGERLIAVVARYVELGGGIMAARRLGQDADRGGFDLAVVVAFLDSLGHAPPVIPEAAPQPEWLALSRFGARRLRRDAAEPLRGPHAAAFRTAGTMGRRDAGHRSSHVTRR